jgi:hypothetical protein
MGMRIESGSSSAQAVSQSTVAQWQQLIQQAKPQPQPTVAPVPPKPTETAGNFVNTYA